MIDRLTEAALRDLASQIDWPPAVDLASRLRLGARPGRRRRPWVVWASVGLAVVIASFFVPATRRAVGNLLEIAGIRMEFGGTSNLSPPTILVPGRRVELPAARHAVDFPILLPSALDAPTAVHVLEWELGTQVFLAWEASDRLPEVGESGTGLLIAEFRASLDEDFFQKIVLEGTTVDRVMVNGVPGFWLAGGPHVFGFETGRSDMVADASRLTGNVLVWEAGGITYRLESILSLEASLAIAESLRP